MAPFSAFVLFAVFWFMTLFVILPLRLTTQGEAGTTVKGTSGSAPENPRLKRKFLLTTVVALVLWGIAVAIIISGRITMEDFDLFRRFGGPTR
jgi:predicted secreted protein